MKRWVPATVAAVLIAGFAALGFWQLDRARDKAQLFASFDAGVGTKAKAMYDVYRLIDVPRYGPVTIEGRYDDRRTFYLDNQTVEGRPGVHVMTPLDTARGTVIVNRGWIPLPDRQRLPGIETPTGRVTIFGAVATPPRTGLRLGDAAWPSGGWPKLVTYFDLDQVSAALDRPVVNRVVLLSPESPDGFLRQWRPRVMSPERHRGYAVQWFALAGAVIIVWALMRRRSSSV